jgi:hypothetical protein
MLGGRKVPLASQCVRHLSMPSAFLSHSSDDKAFVRQIAADLDALGIAVWLDENELLPGARLVRGLASGLEAADYVLLFVSSSFLRSKWTDVEADAALKRAIESRRQSVIPLLLEDVWPRVSPLLQSLIYQDFRDWNNVLAYRAALGRVMAAMTQSRPTLSPTHREVTVLVTGGRSETGGEFGLAVARDLGRQLVGLDEVPLLSGVAEGVDVAFAKGVKAGASARGIDPRDRLMCYVNKGKKAHHNVGQVFTSKYYSRREGVPELVTRADVGFLIGGGNNTMYIGVLTLLEHKLVFPLPTTSGAAADCYDLVLSRYDRVFRQTLPRVRFERLANKNQSSDELVQHCVQLVNWVKGEGRAT